jgi:hypothetical protein
MFVNVAQEQSLECPDNDAEILLNGKLVIRFQGNKILMACSQLLKFYEIVGLPMPCICHHFLNSTFIKLDNLNSKRLEISS